MTMYIRVCIDDDVAAARQAFGAQAMAALTPALIRAAGRPLLPPRSRCVLIVQSAESLRDLGLLISDQMANPSRYLAAKHLKWLAAKLY
jgi:hypothetical protein